MRILSLDTATRTGYALFASEVISSGVFDASIRTKPTKTLHADHPGKRFHDFRVWLRETIRNTRPDVISYERIVGGAVAGGKTTLIQKGLEATVIMEAYRSGDAPIPLWTFAAATIKKWAINDGSLNHESKIAVAAAAYNRFSDQEWLLTPKNTPDDNQADALWILDLTRAVAQSYELFNPTEEELTKCAHAVTASRWSHVNSQ